jgi:hypothetical protein
MDAWVQWVIAAGCCLVTRQNLAVRRHPTTAVGLRASTRPALRTWLVGHGDLGAASVMSDILAKPALLIIKRSYWDQFADGTKTIEYRRHRRMFTTRTFWPGRSVRIVYQYRNATPTLMAEVTRFDVDRAANHPFMTEIYPDLAPSDEIALIHLAVDFSQTK